MTEYILEAEQIYKSYYAPRKVDILKGVDLKVGRGESIAVIGPSGEGKTTLLHILGTLESFCGGKIKIAGQDLVAASKNYLRNRYIGFIFQFFCLLEDYSIIENVLMPAKIARLDTSKGSPAYRKALSYLEQVGMVKDIHQNAGTLSGGEKQRAAIARAFINDPDIIFADEPTGNLDNDNSVMISDLLISFAREKKKSLILATHDHELAKRLDKRYHLSGGLLRR